MYLRPLPSPLFSCEIQRTVWEQVILMYLRHIYGRSGRYRWLSLQAAEVPRGLLSFLKLS
jgi:hypothetical protein